MENRSKSLPQVAYDEGLEASDQYRHRNQAGLEYVQESPPLRSTDRPTIFGLRSQTFWLCLLLLAVVIAAAVGGGVGGSLAVQHAKSKASSPVQTSTVNSVSIVDIQTTESLPALPPSPTIRSALLSGSTTSSATPSTVQAQGSIYTPMRPDIVPLVGNSCPASGNISITFSGQVSAFDCQAGNSGGGDITGLVAYTQQDCLTSCTLANRDGSPVRCVGVAYSGKMKGMYDSYRGNCFLKQTVGNLNGDIDWTILKLI